MPQAYVGAAFCAGVLIKILASGPRTEYWVMLGLFLLLTAAWVTAAVRKSLIAVGSSLVTISSWPYGPLIRSQMDRSDVATIVVHSAYAIYMNDQGQQIGRSRRYWSKNDFLKVAELLGVPLYARTRFFGLLNGGETQRWA